MYQRHPEELLKDAEHVFECNQCPNKYHSRRAMRRHLLQYHPIKKQEKFNCAHCSMIFQCNSALQHHMQVMHTEIRLAEAGDVYSCHLCPKKYAIQDSLRCHLRRFHKGNYKDPVSSSNSPYGRATKMKKVPGDHSASTLNTKKSLEQQKSSTRSFWSDSEQSFGELENPSAYNEQSNYSPPGSSHDYIPKQEQLYENIAGSSEFRTTKQFHTRNLAETMTIVKEEMPTDSHIIEAIEIKEESDEDFNQPFDDLQLPGPSSVDQLKEMNPEKAIATHASPIEYNPLPITVAVFSRSTSHPSEFKIVWSSKLEEDLVLAASMNCLNTIIVVRNLQTLTLPEEQRKMLMNNNVMTFYTLDSEENVCPWTIISFGEQSSPAGLDNKLFPSLEDVEKIYAKHAFTKELSTVNIIKYTDELFNFLADKLSMKTIVFNSSSNQ